MTSANGKGPEVAKKNVPGPSEAVHLVNSRWSNRSVCGQSMKGERELPPSTPIDCPECRRKR
jgi:hypothetical protein